MLEVIGAGFGRTGTNSLREALQILGFDPCHHMYALHEHPETLTDWEAIAAGATPDWDKMFADFRAQVDWPGACYWRDLSEHFPNAKVILSTRDPEGWHKSMMKTVIPTLYAGGTRETDWLNRLSEHNRVTIGERVFGGKSRDPAQAISVYEAHVAEVTATIAPERLLIWEVSDGWAPLAHHLGVPVPDQPFPRTNDAKAFHQRLESGG